MRLDEIKQVSPQGKLSTDKLARAGQGLMSNVFRHPKKSNSVIKIARLNREPEYSGTYQFVELAFKNQDNPFFPRIYNAKLYTYSNETELVIEMEKLVKLTSKMYDVDHVIQIFRNLGIPLVKVVAEKGYRPLRDLHDTLVDIGIDKLASITTNDQFAEALRLVKPLFAFGGVDLHDGNWMIRPTSSGPQLVLTDPISN